jgi:hypothetical protein
MDKTLLWFRFTLAMTALLAMVAAAGVVLYYAQQLDKLTLVLATMLLAGLRDEVKSAFGYFFEGVAKAMDKPADKSDDVAPVPSNTPPTP